MVSTGQLRAVAAATLLICTTSARADVKAGVDAWSRGDFAAAISEWQGPAENGDGDAQFNLGQAYRMGKGVPQDLARAEELFGRAAAQGHLQAADNYGLLLFQRGQRNQAMPYVRAASDRGDGRAQYLLGLAHFNGDLAPKDWVRAYALVSLAQQAGLAPARAALAQMDEHIPLDQRQLAASLAVKLAAEAEASRARQLAAQDLGTLAPPRLASAKPASGPKAAGADYTRPVPAKPAPAPKPAEAAKAPAPEITGSWRAQLGAFGVAANADALWNRIKARPELAGHARINARTGAVTKLQAGGFASQADAQSACKRLAAGGFTCLAVRN